MRIDLKKGNIDAYNFSLSSKNVFINSNDDAKAFFVIKDNAGSNLFYAGSDKYYLKSTYLFNLAALGLRCSRWDL